MYESGSVPRLSRVVTLAGTRENIDIGEKEKEKGERSVGKRETGRRWKGERGPGERMLGRHPGITTMQLIKSH